MQQTTNYKLNLIETSDPFSPKPLNENADKVDAELGRMDAAAQDLAQRMVKLENLRVVMGWYKGNDDSKNGLYIDLGGRPSAVLSLFCGSNQPFHGLVVGDIICSDYNNSMRLTDTGFWVSGTVNLTNSPGYCYLAFFGDYEQKDFPNPPPKA